MPPASPGPLRHDPPTDEQFESIPWDALVTDRVDRRRWTALAAGAALVLAFSFGLSRLIWPVTPPASTETMPTVAPADEVTSLPSVPTLPAPAPPAQSGSLSEADLLALPAEDAGRRAAAYAAWFVAEYFTVDGGDGDRHQVRSLLPAGVEVPPADPAARSFVEGVEVVEVSSSDGLRHRVQLLVRSLAATGEEGYRRQPVRMVEVVVAVDEQGAAVVDLPRPLPVPQRVGAALAVQEGEPPAAVVAAALEAASVWGEPQPDLLSAGMVDERWRVVVGVRDPAGLVWPVAVWADPTGATLPAGG